MHFLLAMIDPRGRHEYMFKLFRVEEHEKALKWLDDTADELRKKNFDVGNWRLVLIDAPEEE